MDQAWLQPLAFGLTVFAMGVTGYTRHWVGLGASGLFLGLQIAALGGM